MAEPFYRANVLVCGGTSCTASGSMPVIAAMKQEGRKTNDKDEQG